MMNDKKIYVVYPIDELALDPAYYGGFELIRCKDCKYYLNSNEECQLISTRLHLHEMDKRWTEDCFCAWAERIEDERVR